MHVWNRKSKSRFGLVPFETPITVALHVEILNMQLDIQVCRGRGQDSRYKVEGPPKWDFF